MRKTRQVPARRENLSEARFYSKSRCAAGRAGLDHKEVSSMTLALSSTGRFAPPSV